MASFLKKRSAPLSEQIIIQTKIIPDRLIQKAKVSQSVTQCEEAEEEIGYALLGLI